MHARQQLTTTWLVRAASQPQLTLFLFSWFLAAERHVQAQAPQATTRATPAEGQLPSPARSRLPRGQPGLSQHLGCGQLPPCCPALTPRSAAPAQPSPRALVPALYGVDPATRLPKPSAAAGSQTCSVAAAAAAAAAILARRSPRLRSGTGVGLTPSTATPGHALATPPKEIQGVSVGSDPWRPVTRYRESPPGCMGVAGIASSLGRPQVLWKGCPQNPKDGFAFHQLPILGYCIIQSCDELRGRDAIESTRE